MTDNHTDIDIDDLAAYLDDRLPPDRRALVERALERDATLRAQMNADAAIRRSLRQRLQIFESLPVPERLTIHSILRRRRDKLHRRLRMAVAGVVLVLGGGAAGWEAHGFASPRMAAREQGAIMITASDAIAAHRVFVVEKAHPVEVGATQEAHLVQWLSRRLGHTLIVPDLSGDGYTLMGGRLLPAGSRAAAQFMYQTTAGQRLTVYVRASGGTDSQFQFVASEGVAAFSWIDQGLGFAIVGDINRTQLLEIADTVYRQVDPEHRPAPAEL